MISVVAFNNFFKFRLVTNVTRQASSITKVRANHYCLCSIYWPARDQDQGIRFVN